MNPYAVFIHSDVMNQLIQMGATRRRRLAEFFEQLGINPHVRGEFTERDIHDRDVEVVIFGIYMVTFFSDHAAREVQILGLEQA